MWLYINQGEAVMSKFSTQEVLSVRHLYLILEVTSQSLDHVCNRLYYKGKKWGQNLLDISPWICKAAVSEPCSGCAQGSVCWIMYIAL